MKTAILIRGGSISPRTEIAGKSPAGFHDPAVDFYRRSRSMRMHLDIKEKRDLPSNPIRRVRSDTDLFLSSPFSSRFSMSPTIKEESEEMLYSGGGMGNGRKKIGGGGGGSGRNGESDPRIGTHYKEMLKSDPGNPLLLRNYAKYLQEVEGDLERAEEYYGRAILANPNDGELLLLYGRLIWESRRDGELAKSYLERAVKASPDDCYVMGSYAQFLWDAEEEEEEEEEEVRVGSKSVYVEAF